MGKIEINLRPGDEIEIAGAIGSFVVVPSMGQPGTQIVAKRYINRSNFMFFAHRLSSDNEIRIIKHSTV